MLELPSRHALTGFTQSINAVIPTVIVGLVRPLDRGSVRLLCWYDFGCGSYIVPIDAVPEVLQRSGQSIVIDSDSPNPIEWRSAFAGASQLVSVPIPNGDAATRLWVGLAGTHPVTHDQVRGLEA